MEECLHCYDEGCKHCNHVKPSADDSQPLNDLLSEVVEVLNDDDSDDKNREALDLFCRHYDIVNRWVCRGCGKISSRHHLDTGCSKCGSMDAVTVVMQANR